QSTRRPRHRRDRHHRRRRRHRQRRLQRHRHPRPLLPHHPRQTPPLLTKEFCLCLCLSFCLCLSCCHPRRGSAFHSNHEPGAPSLTRSGRVGYRALRCPSAFAVAFLSVFAFLVVIPEGDLPLSSTLPLLLGNPRLQPRASPRTIVLKGRGFSPAATVFFARGFSRWGDLKPYNQPMHFPWLPLREDFDDALREVKSLPTAAAANRLRELATSRLDLTQTAKLDRTFLNALKFHGTLPGLEPLRLAILGSATTSHLPPGIRVAGLRRGLAIEIYEAPYGMYYQELNQALNSPGSALHSFNPQAILLALDARHLTSTTAASALDLLQSCWRKA